MALAERDRLQYNGDYAVVRRPLDNRTAVQQITRPYSSYGELVSHQKQALDPAILAQEQAEKQKQSNHHKAQQNKEAIKRYNVNNKGKKVLEGKHAAALDQIHQNDLHNIEQVTELPESKEDEETRNNMAVAKKDKHRGYVTQNQSLQGNYIRGQRTGASIHQSGVGHHGGTRDELSTHFDPMRDKHMWTMWRTAVNGRIVDEVLRLERIKVDRGPTGSAAAEPNDSVVYGRALVAPPLKQFIRFYDDDSKITAERMARLGQGSLRSSQFVYFGLPRVQVAQQQPTQLEHQQEILAAPQQQQILMAPQQQIRVAQQQLQITQPQQISYEANLY